jgi:ribosome-binding factor A
MARQLGQWTDGKRVSMGRRQRSNSDDSKLGSGARVARIQELIREEINFVLRNEIQDPGLDTIEITMVERLGDCARLWFTAEGEADRVPALDRAKGFLRRYLAESLDLKRTPDLRFRRDPASRQFLKDGP